MAVTFLAPGFILRTLDKMVFLAIERLHIAGPYLAMIASHGVVFVVRVDERELGAG